MGAVLTIAIVLIIAVGLTSAQTQTCTNYLGYEQFQVENLLACRSSEELRGSIEAEVSRLKLLKKRVVTGGRKLAGQVNYGEWIDALQHTVHGSCADNFNLRNFDTWTWLFNRQISTVLHELALGP